MLVDLDFRQGMPSIWHGGLPTVHQCRPRRVVAHSFLSRHVPLAIRDEESFDARVESVSFEPGDRLYLLTDGGEIRVNVRDSGAGFERSSDAPMDSAVAPSGRGLDLVEELCTSVAYNERGDEVEAVLHW